MSFTFAFIKTNKMDLLKLKSQAQDNPTQPVDLGTLSLLTTHFFSLLLTLPNSSQCVLNPPHFSSLILTSTHSSLLLLTPPHSSSLLLTFFKNFVLFYPVFVGWKVIFRVKLKKNKMDLL